MNKEIITVRQSIGIMVVFILGSTLVLGAGGTAKQDGWMAVLLSILISSPLFFVYSRLLSLFPGCGLYEILEKVFGRILGKVIALPFIWFSFHLGALVIRNFTEFINIVSIPETPQYIIALFMILLCIWAVKAGVEVIGRWTSFTFPLLIAVISVITFLFLPILDFRNLKPVLYNGFAPVLDSAFSVFAFPLAETILFTTILSNLQKGSSPYKVYFWSLFIGGMIILLVSVRSLLVLGPESVSILYFPSYASVRLINIGNFLQRIEVSVSTIFLLAGFTKTNICLYASSTGLAKVLKISDYKHLVAPVGLAMMTLSTIIYSNTIEMFEWASKIYKYYSIPFEIILPLVIWIAAEIKVRSQKRKSNPQSR